MQTVLTIVGDEHAEMFTNRIQREQPKRYDTRAANYPALLTQLAFSATTYGPAVLTDRGAVFVVGYNLGHKQNPPFGRLSCQIRIYGGLYRHR